MRSRFVYCLMSLFLSGCLSHMQPTEGEDHVSRREARRMRREQRHGMPQDFMNPDNLMPDFNPGGEEGQQSQIAQNPSNPQQGGFRDFTDPKASQEERRCGSPFPTKVEAFNYPPGRDVMKPLKMDWRDTLALVNTDNSNNAMAYQTDRFRNVKRAKTMRHSSLREFFRNVVLGAQGKSTAVVGNHGWPGGSGQLNARNAKYFGKLLCGAGIKKVIFTSCSTGAGSPGRNFLNLVAKYSGAQTFAWDRTLWSSRNAIFMKQPGHVVIATPGPQNPPPQQVPPEQPPLAQTTPSTAIPQYTGAPLDPSFFNVPISHTSARELAQESVDTTIY